MKIRKFKVLDDGVYKIILKTEDWSENDLNLMLKFSEPEIDLGGEFTGPPEFELSSNLVKIKSDTPFTQSFDSRDDVDADDRAIVWQDAISTRIVSAVTTLRALEDKFTGETVENV